MNWKIFFITIGAGVVLYLLARGLSVVLELISDRIGVEKTLILLNVVWLLLVALGLGLLHGH